MIPLRRALFWLVVAGSVWLASRPSPPTAPAPWQPPTVIYVSEELTSNAGLEQVEKIQALEAERAELLERIHWLTLTQCGELLGLGAHQEGNDGNQ